MSSTSSIHAAPLRCSMLLFVATGTELAELKRAAKALEIPFRERRGVLGRYYDLGQIGQERVLAVQTRMGALAYDGSASKALRYRSETQAATIVCLGMAFGINPTTQALGDVLVSRALIPYDYRIIRTGTMQQAADDYSETPTHPANDALVHLFAQYNATREYSTKVHFGIMLSGAARIYCAAFRDHLAANCGHGRGFPVVGGEMEGLGLVATSDPQSPCWILVKGISDFADDEHARVIASTRGAACYNSARFVLSALKAREAGRV